MPQILLEYTSNISKILSIDFPYKTILKEIHRILNEVGKVNLANCKSRVLSHSQYYIGNGNANQAMMHLEITFLEGRSDELKKQMGEIMIQYLQKQLKSLIPGLEDKLDLQITVHFRDIQKTAYFKYPSGTLSNQ